MADVARVIVDLRARELDRPFDYAIPPRLSGYVQAGHRVYVPFGRQFCQGYVIALTDSQTVTEGLKEVAAVLDELPLFPPDLLMLATYIQERTVCTQLEALQAMVPGAYRARGVRRYRMTLQVSQDSLAVLGVSQANRAQYDAMCERPYTLDELVRRFGADALLHLERWLHNGVVEEVVEAEDAVRAKTVATLRAQCDVTDLHAAAVARAKRAPKQAALLAALQTSAPAAVRLSDVNVRPSDPAVRALLRDGLAVVVEEEVYRAPVAGALSDDHPKRALTAAQQAAVTAILDAMEAARLPVAVPVPFDYTVAANGVVLHGVTGSGKTEVYLQAIEAVLDAGGGAIALVPEIALTPQMVSRFTARFGARVAVLHSSLSAGERRDEWLRVRRGEAQVVVGARSAVFAPVRALRLLIVDEAHEATYKQEESPHYDAREVAAWRARAEGAAVVYGSATPSMELLHAAETGQLRRVGMPFRVHNQAMPTVTVVDMRDELRAGNPHLFSEPLRRGLENAVGAGRQAMLFLNRRGFSSFVLCRQCGNAVQCPNCDISLTLHRHGSSIEWLECHYCQYRQPVPDVCEHCGEPAVRPFGVGTQQVEQIVRELWPEWRVLRMDVDTTRRKGSHRDAVAQVLDGEVDVLLGTQMIAKGLDFPNLSFVGVIAADTMLNVPDFRAAERTFSLLTQVIGRAGRAGVPGTTVIQTFRPDHYAVRAAANHDFSAFYPLETSFRRAFEYPPFCELTVFAASHEQESYARGAAARFERELRRTLPAHAATVLPAAPSGIRRTKGQFRFQVVVKYSQWVQVRAALTRAFDTVSTRMRTLGGRCSLDVNALRI